MAHSFQQRGKPRTSSRGTRWPFVLGKYALVLVEAGVSPKVL